MMMMMMMMMTMMMYLCDLLQMLKKAQRDIGNTVRRVNSKLTQSVEDEIESAFRNFSNAILHKEANVCSIRAEYLQMDAKQLLNVIFRKLRQLYTIVADIHISWEGDAAYGNNFARRKLLNRSLSIVNNFASHLCTDSLMQKMFKVVIELCSLLFVDFLLVNCCIVTWQ